MRVLRSLREVPFSAGTVDGWRAWSVVERGGELLLSSLTRAEDWEPSAPFVAACDRRTHTPPRRDCSCGVYAAADPEELAGLGRIAGAAIGQVSLWGRIAEHSRGYRAATAYPARLRLVCVTCLGQGAGVPATRIDRDASSPRSRLVPLCETHTEGRALPPAGPFEERLLATYRVELVPDGTLDRIRRDHHVERAQRGARRRLTIAAAAVLSLMVVFAVFRWRDQNAAVSAAAAASSSYTFRDLPSPEANDGIKLPFDRTSEGLVFSPRIRILLLTPDQFAAPRCGIIRPNDVVPAECADPLADVFIDDVGPAGADREGTCSDSTVVRTTHAGRVFCWRLLPET
jgi:hypothetical protein